MVQQLSSQKPKNRLKKTLLQNFRALPDRPRRRTEITGVGNMVTNSIPVQVQRKITLAIQSASAYIIHFPCMFVPSTLLFCCAKQNPQLNPYSSSSSQYQARNNKYMFPLLPIFHQPSNPIHTLPSSPSYETSSIETYFYLPQLCQLCTNTSCKPAKTPQPHVIFSQARTRSPKRRLSAISSTLCRIYILELTDLQALAANLCNPNALYVSSYLCSALRERGAERSNTEQRRATYGTVRK